MDQDKSEVSELREGVFLASVITSDITEAENQVSLEELARLVETLGLHVYGQFSQKKQGYGSPSVFGEGKLIEIADQIAELKRQGTLILQLVFDRELSPLQGRNVETHINSRLTELECDHQISVSDRTGVIIDIFSRHARTRQAKLQIEMARLKYTAPRLRDQIVYHGDRQAGGIGAKGSGETLMELKRRELRDQLADLRRELESLEHENESRRGQREAQSVAIVGYTNAGKSSLMRSLVGTEIYVADKLFATLDVTTRQLDPPVVPAILVSDTVGFVRHLPHDLVASFKSSLAEVRHADFLLHVIDAADPQFAIQMRTTDEVLKEIGADQQARHLVFNKIDKLSAEQRQNLESEYPQAWWVSALKPESVAELRLKIIEHFEQSQKQVQVLIPFSETKIVGEIHKHAKVTSETYSEAGTLLSFHLKPEDLARLRSRFPETKFEEQ
jgi:GTP-binding protein HflX